MSTPTDEVRLLTKRDVQDRLSISSRMMDRLITNGTIPIVHIGSAVRVRSDVVQAYIDSITEASA